jgi:hypothetical protein
MGNSKVVCALAFVSVLLAASVILQSSTEQATPHTLTVPDDYPTIQAAVGNASNGDTVYVKNGVYRGQDGNHWLTIDKSINLIGQDNQQTIIRPPLEKVQGEYIIKVTADDVTISGIRIQGPNWAPTGIMIARAENTPPKNIQILNCFIENCSNAVMLDGSNITVDRNYLIDNGWGVRNEASNVTISNNLIEDNGIGIGQAIPGGTVQDSCYVYGNLISQNYEGGIVLAGGPHYIYNNNITNNPGYGILFGGNKANVYGNEISFNGIAIKTISIEGSGKDNYIYVNNFIENLVSSSLADPTTNWMTQALMQPVDINLDKDNQGNYWSSNQGNGSYLVGDTTHILYDYYPLSQPVNIDSSGITSLPTLTPTNQTPTADSGNWMIDITIIAVSSLIIICVAVTWILFSRKEKTSTQ